MLVLENYIAKLEQDFILFVCPIICNLIKFKDIVLLLAHFDFIIYENYSLFQLAYSNHLHAKTTSFCAKFFTRYVFAFMLHNS